MHTAEFKAKSFSQLLVCPVTNRPLEHKGNVMVEPQAGRRYEINENGQPDLRLNELKDFPLTVTIGKLPPEYKDKVYDDLPMAPDAEVDFSSMGVPYRMSAEILSHFPKAKGAESYGLDLGCGSTMHKPAVEFAGFKYVGFDYSSKQADVLGDAHALPFPDNTFDFVCSFSVLEHIQHPYIYSKEVNRVLKPGGKFIGIVSFMEPFHDNSYYHHSHMGVYNTLEQGNFDIKHVAHNHAWNVIYASKYMHILSKAPAFLINTSVFFSNLLFNTWWSIMRMRNPVHFHPFDKRYQRIAATGSFTFVAVKK